MRVNINGLPQLEQGGRLLSTNVYFGTSAMALNSTALMPVEKQVNSTPSIASCRQKRGSDRFEEPHSSVRARCFHCLLNDLFTRDAIPVCQGPSLRIMGVTK
jgi:hypothetical protein